MSIEAQATLAEEFVRGVVSSFRLDATVSSTIEDDYIRVAVDGESVGYLIGPKGATIDALQELTRTVVQRRSDDAGGRINVDVGGYRARRAAALAQFAEKVAREVVEGGLPQALEPMSPADRKVVHDALNEVEGVTTSSEGEEPRRYVVIHPSAAPSSSEEEHTAGDDNDEVQESSEEADQAETS
jgi:spoIIIJ-associated protein